MTDIEETIRIAANPVFITSASKANLLLADLNAIISDLRLEVAEVELKSELYLNELLKNGKGVELQKSNWKTSEIYREWKTKAGHLADVRAIRRSLERHYELLYNQEKYGRSYNNMPKAI